MPPSVKPATPAVITVILVSDVAGAPSGCGSVVLLAGVAAAVGVEVGEGPSGTPAIVKSYEPVTG